MYAIYASRIFNSVYDFIVFNFYRKIDELPIVFRRMKL